ncbi:hypothetical protein ACE6H2_000108 [Prunus campanulata]
MEEDTCEEARSRGRLGGIEPAILEGSLASGELLKMATFNVTPPHHALVAPLALPPGSFFLFTGFTVTATSFQHSVTNPSRRACE